MAKFGRWSPIVWTNDFSYVRTTDLPPVGEAVVATVRNLRGPKCYRLATAYFQEDKTFWIAAKDNNMWRATAWMEMPKLYDGTNGDIWTPVTKDLPKEPMLCMLTVDNRGEIKFSTGLWIPKYGLFKMKNSDPWNVPLAWIEYPPTFDYLLRMKNLDDYLNGRL